MKTLNYFTGSERNQNDGLVEYALLQCDKGVATIQEVGTDNASTCSMDVLVPVLPNREAELTEQYGVPNLGSPAQKDGKGNVIREARGLMVPRRGGFFTTVKSGPIVIDSVSESDGELSITASTLDGSNATVTPYLYEIRLLPKVVVQVLLGERMGANDHQKSLRENLKALDTLRKQQIENKPVSMEDWEKSQRGFPKIVNGRTTFPEIRFGSVISMDGQVLFITGVRKNQRESRLADVFATARIVIRKENGELALGNEVQVKAVCVKARNDEAKTPYGHNNARYIPDRVEDKIRRMSEVKTLVLAAQMGKMDMIRK